MPACQVRHSGDSYIGFFLSNKVGFYVKTVNDLFIKLGRPIHVGCALNAPQHSSTTCSSFSSTSLALIELVTTTVESQTKDNNIV